MDQDMITDITLDHLPDLSEASVSFQIPADDAAADLLLADRTDGFDAFCHADDDDASFAPVATRQTRGRPLTLGELTPRVQAPPRARSRTTRSPSSSAKPAVVHHPLTLGRRSPDKPRKTPSRATSIQRQPETPLVSEERLHQLRAELETLGQPGEAPSHVQVHPVEQPEDRHADHESLPPATLDLVEDAPASPPASVQHRLDPLPEEREVETSPDQDVAMATGEDCLAETTLPVPQSRPELRRNPRTSAKPTVAAGGISKRHAFPVTHVSKKTKNKPSRVREAHQHPPSAARQITPPQSIATDTEKELVPPACLGGDIDIMSENTQITRPSTGGMAERLVSYSQRLISSIGLYKPCPEHSSPEAPRDVVTVAQAHDRARLPDIPLPPSPPSQRVDGIPNGHSEPLRLSEISPYKQPPCALLPSSAAQTRILQDGAHHAMSPLRRAKKRVSTVADPAQDCHRRKRGKKMPASTDPERGSSDEAASQAPRLQEGHPVTQSETCDDAQLLGSSKPTLPSARTKYRPKLNSSSLCKGPTLDPFPYLSRSRQARTGRDRVKRDQGQAQAANVGTESSLGGISATSRLRQARRARQGDVTESSHGRQRSGPIPTVDLALIEKKQQNATLSVPPLTKPVGFTFRVDARLEARKTEERLAASEPGKTPAGHAVPDFKALRASHQAERVVHRDGVVPSVPVVPFFFCTEQRAKEREKFDETVRRKEEEVERLKEEQRRREAEEEERTIKALRRRAIPKANEVPEWYADMPKRKGTAA